MPYSVVSAFKYGPSHTENDSQPLTIGGIPPPASGIKPAKNELICTLKNADNPPYVLLSNASSNSTT